MLANPVGDHLRNVDVGEDVGLRIHLAQRLDNLLAAAHADEPVVNDCDPHQMLSFESLPWGSRSTLEGAALDPRNADRYLQNRIRLNL